MIHLTFWSDGNGSESVLMLMVNIKFYIISVIT